MITIRTANTDDSGRILALYRAVAAMSSGLARRIDEIDLDYVQTFLANACSDGVSLLAIGDHEKMVGEIHASRIGPAQFAHVLSDITIAVHPERQGQGVGKRQFQALFAAARTLHPRVTRFELMAREGNAAAIGLYERLGFRIEGRFVGRVRLPDGSIEDDVAMARVIRD